MIQKTLGGEIRRLRELLGVSLRRFADDIGASAAHVSDIEHGRRAPSKELLASIAEQLSKVGGSLEYLEGLDPRLEPELQDWMDGNPEVRQLLRTVHDSRRPISELLAAMQAELRRRR